MDRLLFNEVSLARPELLRYGPELNLFRLLQGSISDTNSMNLQGNRKKIFNPVLFRCGISNCRNPSDIVIRVLLPAREHYCHTRQKSWVISWAIHRSFSEEPVLLERILPLFHESVYYGDSNCCKTSFQEICDGFRNAYKYLD